MYIIRGHFELRLYKKEINAAWLQLMNRYLLSPFFIQLPKCYVTIDLNLNRISLQM